MLWFFMLFSLGAGIGAAAAGLLPGQAALVCLGCFVALNLAFVLFLLIVSLTAGSPGPVDKPRRICSTGCIGIGAWMSQWAGLRVRVRGAELLPEQGRFLMVCNHRSLFDPIATEYGLRRYRLAFVSKPSNMQLPFLGRLAYGAGFLSIDRENDREALKTILKAADYLRRGLCSVCIYPEGTRSSSEALLPFHAGSFKIAQKANVPLAVAAIHGTDKIRGHFLRRPKDVTIEILALIPAEEVRATSTRELAARSRALMEKALGLSSEEGQA